MGSRPGGGAAPDCLGGLTSITGASDGGTWIYAQSRTARRLVV